MNEVTEAISKAANIKEAFDAVFELETDMRACMPTLASLARDCKSIVEFGVRYGVSTIAFMHGMSESKAPDSLRSVDIEIPEGREQFDRLNDASPFVWMFEECHSLDYSIDPECDLLLIDTFHEASQLRAELNRHAFNVRKWILLHDTETFGWNAENGPGEAGLLLGLGRFLVDNFRDWRIKAHWTSSNGLTLLERRQEGETVKEFGEKPV